MTKKKYRRYSPEFKRHALKRASENAKSMSTTGKTAISNVDRRYDFSIGVVMRISILGQTGAFPVEGPN